MVHKWTPIALILVVAVTLAGCTVATDVMRAFQVVIRVFQTEEVIEETYQVQPGTTLELHNTNGDITVTVGDDNEIHIRATKRGFGAAGDLDHARIDVTTGDRMMIETTYLTERSNVAVDYEIIVPSDVSLNQVTTSNGYIRVEDAMGDVTATSSNGNIHLENIDGYVRATTSNGSIHIKNCTGVRSGVRTSNGNIHIEMKDIQGNVEIRTGNGSITAYLSQWLRSGVTMTASNGQVTSDHNHLVIGKSSRGHLAGQIGEEAEHEILMRTSNGNVTVRQIGE